MKKLIALFFALALAVSAASCESMTIDEFCYYYGYGHIEVTKSGAPAMSIIYLAEDHTCYYLTEMFNKEAPVFGRAYVGTWELMADGSIFAQVGENATRTLKPSVMNTLVDVETLEVFSSFDALMR
ncbi:MAG: hypothetical protein J6U01_05955 [Clostridia bacterium]|nr:hypothetical protein [Clostridia bacterium]